MLSPELSVHRSGGPLVRVAPLVLTGLVGAHTLACVYLSVERCGRIRACYFGGTPVPSGVADSIAQAG